MKVSVIISNYNYARYLTAAIESTLAQSYQSIDILLGGYRIYGANRHMNLEATQEQIAKALLGVEMTNQYINEFLEHINYPTRVDLSLNLQLRREQYYAKKIWNLPESWSISRLILGWSFHNCYEKIYYLMRFWGKNFKILSQTTFINNKRNRKQFAQ